MGARQRVVEVPGSEGISTIRLNGEPIGELWPSPDGGWVGRTFAKPREPVTAISKSKTLKKLVSKATA